MPRALDKYNAMEAMRGEPSGLPSSTYTTETTYTESVDRFGNPTGEFSSVRRVTIRSMPGTEATDTFRRGQRNDRSTSYSERYVRRVSPVNAGRSRTTAPPRRNRRKISRSPPERRHRGYDGRAKSVDVHRDPRAERRRHEAAEEARRQADRVRRAKIALLRRQAEDRQRTEALDDIRPEVDEWDPDGLTMEEQEQTDKSVEHWMERLKIR